MKSFIHTVLAGSLALLCVCCTNKEEKVESEQYVKTETVGVSNQLSTLTFPGKTRTTEEVNVAFKLAGTLSRVPVNEGDYVSKGQLIAELDPRDYLVQLAATKAEYAMIKADASRVISMYSEGNTTASNYDKARYGLQQIEQKLIHHQNQVADTKIYAPISGYIQTKLHKAGETIGQGMPVVSMFSGGGVEIEVYLPAKDFANRDKLTNCYCTFDIMPDEKFPLELVRVNPEANSSQLFSVRFRIKGNYNRKNINPGMSTLVYANMATETKSDVNIPTSAIVNKNGKTFVYVYKDGVVKRRNIEVDNLMSNGTTNIASGLSNGDVIVTAGVHQLTDGQKVKPLPEKSKSNIGGLL